MNKIILSTFIFLSIILGTFGCSHVNESSKLTDIDNSTLNQDDLYYIVQDDWITLCFSKEDFNENTASMITNEAKNVMKDIRNFLNINYTLEQAKDTICYFDSNYRFEGQSRSRCFWEEKIMYCVVVDDFVHEYVHMISQNNSNLVYKPSKLFIEGLAEYVSLNFYNGIASKKYEHFMEKSVSKVSNELEHQQICDLLLSNGFEYNAPNYIKATVSIIYDLGGLSKLDPNSDFYQYSIGFIFVDYYIKQFGGIEKFMSVYCDNVIIRDISDKTIEELVLDACEYNSHLFYQ